MLFVIDLPAHVVLLPIDLLAFLGSQVAVVSCAVRADFSVHRGLAPFRSGCLGRSETAGRYAVRDTALLIEPAAIDSIHCRRAGLTVIYRGELRAVHARRALV